MKALAPPTYTQIPNEIIDAMADMEDSELRVLLAVCRQTFGWHKQSDILTLTQLMELTGVSRPAVTAGIRAAMKRGLLLRASAGTQTLSYSLNIKGGLPTDAVDEEQVNSVYRSTQFTGKVSLPVQVNSIDRLRDKPVNSVDHPPLKKDLKKLKERAAAAASDPPAQNVSMDQGRQARNGHQPSAQNVSPAAAAAAAVFGAIISPTDALRLVETHPECIDHAEALVREASKPKINDPAAMLVHLVTTGWIPPAGNGANGQPAGDDEVNGYLVGYCPTCAAITFGSCGHDEQQAVASGRGSRKGRKATV